MGRYVISDHHFGHANIIEYCDRPFSSVGKMNSVLLDRHYETVDTDDTLIHFRESLDERILSSLQDREFVFPPYDANQLRKIMYNREDAFKEGVLSDDVIPLSAAFAAQEHGDARKALDILRNAGELAKDEGTDTVTGNHVRDAREKATIDRFSQLLEGQPTQIKASVYALSILADQHSDREEFATREIYEMYKNVTSDSALGIKTLSQRRMSDKLDEQVFLDILGQVERVGRGYSSGVTNYYYLLEEPSVVKAVILNDSRFSELETN